MKDQLGREINYMRVSITERCNLRCRYCIPSDTPELDFERILTYEEILKLCACAAKLGISRFKITGGEPLIRRGCTDFMKRLKQLPGVEQVTVTTNGMALEKHLPALKEAGINGINVSLDTLNAERFHDITGFYGLEKVLAGIEAAVAADIPVKINCVPLKGWNEEELISLAELAAKWPVDVRFIELMPIGYGREYAGVQVGGIEELIKDKYPGAIPTDERRGNGPARYLRIPGFYGCVGFIDAIHEKFCSKCNRVRLTSTGIMKPCLFYKSGTDFRTLLRKGADEEQLLAVMKETIWGKFEEHHFYEKEWETEEEEKRMSQIGG